MIEHMLSAARDAELFQGITSERIDGFYAFPLDKPYEIDSGERCLTNCL